MIDLRDRNEIPLRRGEGITRQCLHESLHEAGFGFQQDSEVEIGGPPPSSPMYFGNAVLRAPSTVFDIF